MKIGFTGTRQGMTDAQSNAFEELFVKLFHQDLSVREFHHGDCIGSDEEADALVRVEPGVFLHVHPCNLFRQRAYTTGDFEYTEMPPLKRNREIVDATEVLIATPSDTKEIFRGSGTWATVRYARKQGRKIHIIFPDGSIKEEDWS